LPDSYIQDAGPSYSCRRLFVAGPLYGIPQQFEVVNAQHLPENPINVPWKIDNPAATYSCSASLRPPGHVLGARDALPGGNRLTQVRLGLVGPGDSRINLLHREIGIAWNQRQRGAREFFARFDVEPPNTVNYPRGPF